MARTVALETDDPKAKITKISGVGSVLVKGGIVIASEANRVPDALKHAYQIDDPSSPERYDVIEHSERNTLYAAWNSGISPEGGTLYCTRFPCTDCARAIILSGISRLVVPTGGEEDNHWRSSQITALNMLRAAGVTVRYLSDDVPAIQ